MPSKYHCLQNDFGSTTVQIKIVIHTPRFTQLGCLTCTLVARSLEHTILQLPRTLEQQREEKRRGEEMLGVSYTNRGVGIYIAKKN